MSIKRLYGKASAHVPNRNCLIGRAWNEKVGEWLEVQAIYRVSVLSVLLSNFECMHIVELNHTVSTWWKHEIASVMEFNPPYRTSVYVAESVRDRGAQEIPKFKVSIATGSDKMWTCGVEVNGRNPVFMAFTRHDILTWLHVPDFPGTVIGRRRHNLLSGMQRKPANTFAVSINFPAIV